MTLPNIKSHNQLSSLTTALSANLSISANDIDTNKILLLVVGTRGADASASSISYIALDYVDISSKKVSEILSNRSRLHIYVLKYTEWTLNFVTSRSANLSVSTINSLCVFVKFYELENVDLNVTSYNLISNSYTVSNTIFSSTITTQKTDSLLIDGVTSAFRHDDGISLENDLLVFTRILTSANTATLYSCSKNASTINSYTFWYNTVKSTAEFAHTIIEIPSVPSANPDKDINISANGSGSGSLEIGTLAKTSFSSIGTNTTSQNVSRETSFNFSSIGTNTTNQNVSRETSFNFSSIGTNTTNQNVSRETSFNFNSNNYSSVNILISNQLKTQFLTVGVADTHMFITNNAQKTVIFTSLGTAGVSFNIKNSVNLIGFIHCTSDSDLFLTKIKTLDLNSSGYSQSSLTLTNIVKINLNSSGYSTVIVKTNSSVPKNICLALYLYSITCNLELQTICKK